MFSATRRRTIRTIGVRFKRRRSSEEVTMEKAPATGIRDPRDAARLVQDALTAADLERLVGMYADDAVVVPSPGEVVQGSAAIRDVLKGWLAEGSLSLKPRTVHQVGDIALEVIEWTMEGAGSPENSVTGLAATVLRRETDGTWRVQIDNCYILE
jgi:uncharacterized protein (TIGR02246 family)